MAKARDLLPPRKGESDEEARLREAVNRLGGQMLATLDAAISLRTAPAEAQKARHTARQALQDFALRAQFAMSLTEAE